MGHRTLKFRLADLARAARALALLAAASIAVAGHARAEAPVPGQVIGYANADKSGPSQAWDLPPDKPYLYIPFVGAELAGRVALVETGAEVGAVLFQRPYFASRDIGCQPDIGTGARPDLRWLGATARIVPAPPEQPTDPALDPGAGGGYGSLILFRGDLGPPPGALLLDRRATVGMRCANVAHNTAYNRLFVPMAEAPEAERCFDLSGDYPGGGADDPVTLDFPRSDRLILLMPGDAQDRYAPIRHDLSVALYDAPACRGRSVSFASRAQFGGDIRLDQYDFRDRARSIRIVYDDGNAAPFLVRRPPPEAPAPAVAQTPAPAPAPAPPAPNVLRSAEPMSDPAVGTPVQPAPEPAPATASRAAPEPEPAPEPAPATPPVPALAPPAPPAAAAAAPVPPPIPAVAMPAPAPAPVPAGSAPARAAPAPAAPRTVQQAMPKLSPVLPPARGEPVAAAAGLRRFEYPTHDIYRLNACLHWQKDCGAPAAAAWCAAQGFARAVDWTLDEAIGAHFPSLVIGDGRVCAEAWCSGFRDITCAR